MAKTTNLLGVKTKRGEKMKQGKGWRLVRGKLALKASLIRRFKVGDVTTTVSTTNIQLNDTAVTVDSARHPNFQEIQAYIGGSNGRNHSMVRRPDVASFLLQFIRNAESAQ